MHILTLSGTTIYFFKMEMPTICLQIYFFRNTWHVQVACVQSVPSIVTNHSLVWYFTYVSNLVQLKILACLSNLSMSVSRRKAWPVGWIKWRVLSPLCRILILCTGSLWLGLIDWDQLKASVIKPRETEEP